MEKVIDKIISNKFVSVIGGLAVILGFLTMMGVWAFLVVDTHQIIVDGITVVVENPYIEFMTAVIGAVFIGGIAFIFKYHLGKNKNGGSDEKTLKEN